VRTVKTFQGTHISGASRGLLCDSSAVLFVVVAAPVRRYFVSVHTIITITLLLELWRLG